MLTLYSKVDPMSRIDYAIVENGIVEKNYTLRVILKDCGTS